MRKRKSKYTMEQVQKLRNLLSADKELSIPEAGRRVGIHSKQSAGHIYRNTPKWCYDPNYVPVPRKSSDSMRRAAVNARHVRQRGPRKPATKYKYHCALCGMGYGAELEAKKCCEVRI